MNGTGKIDQFSALSEGFQKFYDEVLSADFPCIKPKASAYWGNEIYSGARFDGELSLNNLFKGSPYQYEGSNDFIHFTSCESLDSILRSGFMRASEFRHLEDKNELKYGMEIVQPQIDQIEMNEVNDLKQSLFTFSMCRFDSKTLQNKYMWTEYSGNGCGVAVRFKLNKPEHHSFAIGSVLYGDDNLSILEKIKTRAECFAQEGHLFPRNFIDLLTPICAFHKKSSFVLEQEVRLLFRHKKAPFEKHNDVSIYEERNCNDSLRYFKEIPLWEKLKNNANRSNKYSIDEWSKVFLNVQITDIYFGNRIPDSILLSLVKVLINRKDQGGFTFKIWRLNTENLEVPII
jgi:hypothetical protein